MKKLSIINRLASYFNFKDNPNKKNISDMIRNTQDDAVNLATFDLLTQLPNRYLFEVMLTKSLLRSKKNQTMLALFYINIDNFKNVNNSFSYAIGDIFLKKAAERLWNNARQEDVIARLGSDEFSIILEDIQSISKIMFTVQRMIDSFRQPFIIDEKEIISSVSIGVAIYPDEEDSVEHIMQHANNALYQAKDAGGNCYQFYNKAIQPKLERYTLIAKHLRNAIQDNQFELYYQPQVDAPSNSLVGIEALLRWNNPLLQNPEPSEFIPIAEEIGLINRIGAWVITTALQQYDAWYQNINKIQHVRISINISPLQLGDNIIIETVTDILKKIAIPTQNILFELTETAVMKKTLDSKSLVHTFFMELGIGLSIDDFGTGYSSLVYLKQLPIKELKIDKSFIDDIGKNKNSETIIKAIIALAKTLNLEIVAEGVDTREQLDFLQANQCQIIQGYYFSKPLSVGDMNKFIG